MIVTVDQPETGKALTIGSGTATAVAKPSPPLHLRPLFAEDWAVWNWVCVRGAGFPSHLVQRLSSPGSVAAANAIMSSEANGKDKVRRAANSVRKQLTDTSGELQRKQLGRTLKALSKDKLPANLDDLPASLKQELLDSRDQEQQAVIAFKTAFGAEVTQISHAVREIASDDRFQRAVLLQNPKALRHVRHAFESPGGPGQKRGFKERQNEELVASYLQRYCVKNDTIGFFGPVGWAKIIGSGLPISARPGAHLIEKSSVYLEHWCVEALAEKISENDALRVWIAPRRLPFFRIEGLRLYVPGGTSRVLSPLQAGVLARCDGERTARQISLEMMRLPGSAVRTELEVYSILRHFAEKNIIAWKLELPVEPCSEDRLRALLRRIGSDSLRSPALAALDELEAARDQVAEASHDSTSLDAKLESLETTFSRLTGKESSRAAGKMYAGRTLIYNDCRRDLNVEIGPTLIHAIGEPLSLILDAARWFTHRAAQIYRQAFQSAHRSLTVATGASSVDALQFWVAVQDLILDPEKCLFNQLIPELQASWQDILNIPWEKSRAEYKSADLRPKVRNAFRAPAPGWKTARHHSPDVMIAAPDIRDILSGNYLLVLGELHMAANTLRGAFAMSQHPAPNEMLAAITADLPGTHLFPTPPRSWPSLTTRTSVILLPEHHYQVEVSADSVSSAPRARTLPLSALVVENSGGDLIVRTRDRKLSVTIFDFLGEVLSLQAVEFMKMLPPRPHTPRITVDRLVISRESWRIRASEISFINEAEESARFLGARRWKESLHLPRFVFAKVHVEAKPVYVDFDSPIYVDLFCKMVRRVLASDRPEEKVAISEMLPTPDQVWLPDNAGEKYTSELRIVVSDQA
jgi:hypothetical protein